MGKELEKCDLVYPSWTINHTKTVYRCADFSVYQHVSTRLEFEARTCARVNCAQCYTKEIVKLSFFIIC